MLSPENGFEARVTSRLQPQAPINENYALSRNAGILNDPLGACPARLVTIPASGDQSPILQVQRYSPRNG
jgi:hypothetical protein